MASRSHGRRSKTWGIAAVQSAFRSRSMRLRAPGFRLGLHTLSAVIMLLLPLQARATSPVTEWTVLADRIGRGAANWRTLAIMHQAMHDAWNAALPSYARWFPPSRDEPPGDGALPQAALAAAARRVLLSL